MGSRAPRHRAQRGSSGLPNALQAVGVAGGALAAVAVLTVVAGGSSRIQGPIVGDPTSATTSPARPFTSSGSGGSTPTQGVAPVPARSLPPQAPGTTAPPPYAPAARPASVPPTQFTRASPSPPGPTSAPTSAPTATKTPRPTTTKTPKPTGHPTRPVTPGIPPTSSPSPSPTG